MVYWGLIMAGAMRKQQSELPLVDQDVDELDVKSIRVAMGFNRAELSEVGEIPYSTLRSWEEKDLDRRKSPTGAARTLLRLCAVNPQLMREVLLQAHEHKIAT